VINEFGNLSDFPEEIQGEDIEDLEAEAQDLVDEIETDATLGKTELDLLGDGGSE